MINRGVGLGIGDIEQWVVIQRKCFHVYFLEIHLI